MFKKGKKVILIRAGGSHGRLPHALLSLATNLDNEVLILDEATPGLVWRKHRDEIKNAICVGISTITGTYIKSSLEVAQVIRSINPGVPLIWGGWHPSLKPEQTLENEYVDKVIVGQGEQAFCDIVESLKNGKKTDDIIAYEYIDKSKFPVYNFDLIRNMERYIIPYVSPRTISLYTQQGCPFGCKFCAINSVYGRKYSGWCIESVVDLIDYSVGRYFIDGVHFDDDNFFIGKKRALEFANQLLRSNIKINWSSDTRIDVLCNLETEEWEMLDRSGCKRLLVGAESGAQATLDRLNKGITPEMILEFGNLCHRFNIIPSFSMMVGVPGETQEDIEETFKLIDTFREKIPASELLLFLYTPYPGTPLFDLSLKMGFEEPGSLKDWGEFYLDVPTVPWIDDKLIERIRKYKKMFARSRDISLKNKRRFRIKPLLYIHKIQKLVSKFSKVENKREALLRYSKKKFFKTK
ncbi:MAG: B12-binding domain-containing radical SAM protein [Candidatus Aureabacteria bacterium]|nr:B12-binding domain-containing radical SAM protein [Candidatus Auribacterota bacterium]MCK5160637.1 B12-binding domain-containing radical SAM protein [Candidatus Auribacterota bacterium]